MGTSQKPKTTFVGSVTGSSSAVLPGPRVFGAWYVTTSDFRARLRACIWSFLLALCFINGWPFPVLEHFSRSSH
jgi:hypothetical protein